MAVNASPALFNGNGGLPLGRLLAYHAAREPRRPALVIGDETISREQLEAQANRRARMLAAEGVKAGDLVTIALPNGLEFYETTFALWKLGAVPNVVSHKLPVTEFSALLAVAQPKMVIGANLHDLAGYKGMRGGRWLDESLSAEELPEAISPHWKAMASGGSTGRPKIIVDHMPGLWDPKVTVFGQRPDDVLLNPGPLYHNAPFVGMHYGLFAGATVVEMGRFDAERALALVQERKVGWVNFVPTMMHRIWRLGSDVRARFDLASLHTVFHMAAPCPIWLKQAWIDWLGPERIFELYAGTERQGTTLISGTEWLERRGSVGKPQPGSRIRVLDDAGRDCRPGETGEIYFLPDTGRGTTYHYIGAAPKTLGDWESLGDLGYFDEAGYLYLSDRRTDLILSGGANIYPAEVEAALAGHPKVNSAIVIGLPDAEWGQRVHAIVELAPGVILQAEDLLNHASAHLARYKLPKTFEFVNFPLRDDAGKARRNALRDERAGRLSSP